VKSMNKKLLIIALLLLSVGLLAACGGSHSSIQSMQVGRTALVGTVPFSAPYVYQKEGTLVGPEAELAKRIVAKVDESRETKGGTPVRLTWINRTYATLFDAVKKGEVQLALGAFGKSEERAKDVLFSDSYYTMDLVMAVNPLNKDLTPAEIGSARIGVRDGSAVQEFVTAKYPSATITPYGTLDDAVLALRAGDVDTIVDEKEMVAYTLTTIPGAGNMDFYPETLGSIEIAVAVKKGDTQLVELINTVIAESKQDMEGLLREHAGERVTQVLKKREDRLFMIAQAKKSRNVTIRVSRVKGYRGVDIYRMANLRFVARNKETGGTTNSSPIQFSGSTGITKVSVIPGTYALSLTQFNFNTELLIVPGDPDNVSVRITIGPSGVTMEKD
jgi:arginine/lysine/histidine transporter system substrate-binding protein